MKWNKQYVNWRGRWKRKIESYMPLNWILKRFVKHFYYICFLLCHRRMRGQ